MSMFRAVHTLCLADLLDSEAAPIASRACTTRERVVQSE